MLAITVLLSGAKGYAQAPGVTVGENTHMNASGQFTAGYSGDYGDAIPSDHGLTFGGNGQLSGYYYNPSFLNFSATPYYNESRADSSFQSLTAASGIEGSANFFAGSNFPGSFSYHYDRNTSGTLGLAGQPNFTTIGNSQGFGINWSALFPDWPTLSVGYSQGSGSGTIYGTDQESGSSTKLFNVHSSYAIAGFHLGASFSHNSLDSHYPEFLAGEGESSDESIGQSLSFSAQHSLPVHGSFYANFTRSSQTGEFSGSTGFADQTNYTDDIENAGASFRPTEKLSFNVSESYTSNLSGYLSQTLSTGGGFVPVNLGSGAHSITMSGGLGYQLTHFMTASAVATHYDQFYFGEDYTGTFLSGSLACSRRLFNMFSFSASVVDSSNAENQNVVGFIGTLNFARNFLGWNTAASFTYAQNVQTVLLTYTTSYYNYSANIRRRIGRGWSWTGAFNGSHSGLTDYTGMSSHSEGYATSLGSPRLTLSGGYNQSTGASLLSGGSIIGLPPTPGVDEYILFNGDSYNGGLSVTPLRKLLLSASYGRAISNTTGATFSHNDMQIYNAQMQYHLRRIGLQAGYTRFSQGISAVGTPASTTSYFVGFSRWFDFF